MIQANEVKEFVLIYLIQVVPILLCTYLFNLPLDWRFVSIAFVYPSILETMLLKY
jgi:hypothetical protein